MSDSLQLQMSASSQANNSCDVSPRSAWAAILRETVIEVFATMAGVTVLVPDGRDVQVLAQVTGMVGLTERHIHPAVQLARGDKDLFANAEGS
jgi:hypothetical protein